MPDFKVLLYAYRFGDPLPQIRWSSARDSVTVEVGGVKDDLEFRAAKSGKTNLTLRCANQVIVSVNCEFQPIE